MEPVRIIITDDHLIMRQGLRALLSVEPDFIVVGDAGNAQDALEQVVRLQPDILLLDIMLPDMDGLTVARMLRDSAPQTRILILSMYADEGYVIEALKYGAMGYVLKEASMDILALAVRTVMSGRRYLCPPLSERAIEVYMRQVMGAASTQENASTQNDVLTNREREVLRMAAQGQTSSAIAQELFISPRTAETHRARAMKKLNLHTQAELFQYAVQNGLISVNSDNTL